MQPTSSPIQLRFEPLQRDVLRGVRDPARQQQRIGVDLGVVPYFSDERPLQGLAALLDWRGCGFLSRLVRSGWLTGRAREAALLPGPRGFPAQRLLLFGLGSSDAFVAEESERLITEVVRAVLRLHPRDVLFSMPAWLQDPRRSQATLATLTQALRDEGGLELDFHPGQPIPKARPLMPGAAARAQQRAGVVRLRTPASLPIEQAAPAVEPAAPAGDPADDGETGHRGELAAAMSSASGESVSEVRGSGDADTEASGAVPEHRLPLCWWIVAEEDHVGPLRDVLRQVVGPPDTYVMP